MCIRDRVYAAARENGFAFALEAARPGTVGSAGTEDSEDASQQNLSLLDVAEAAERKARAAIGVSAVASKGLTLSLTPELRALLEDASVPKHVHDWKQTLHALKAQGVELRGAVDDTMLLSYALNPTHATQALADVAARNGQAAPTTPAAAALAVSAMMPGLKAEVEKAGVERVYREIDLPLAPVLFRMEEAGVRICLLYTS